jgi:hypothetical protein
MEGKSLKKGLTVGLLVVFFTMSVPIIASSNLVVWIHPSRDDTTPPVTTLTFDPDAPDGTNGWYKSNVTVTLNATDDLSGVNITYYKINDGEWESYDAPFVFTTSNYYTIEYYSIDVAGNIENVSQACCKVDVVPPVTTYHIDGVSFIICSFWATDDLSGVLKTVYQIDGGAWGVYGAPFMITTDSSSHIIRFFSVDKAGNEEDIKQIIIPPAPDKTPPVISLVVEQIFLNKWKFTAQADDDGSGIDRVEFYVDDQLLGSVFDPGPYLWNWTCPDSEGHAVQAIAYDRAGNWAASDIIMDLLKSYTIQHSTSQHMIQYLQYFLLNRYMTQFF